jgi:flagellar motor switch protein FliN/FliY
MAGDEHQQVGQDEVEELLRQARAAGPKPPAPAPPVAASQGAVGQDEIEALLASAPKAGVRAAAPAVSPDDASKILGQSDIEALFTKTTPAPQVRSAATASALPALGDGGMTPGDIELLLQQAEQALASVNSPHQETPSGARNFLFEEFSGTPASQEAATLELIHDVELDLKIELGRTHMYLEEVLKLRRGSVVALDKSAGDPVDIYVNGRLIARGEVLVLNENFCVRVAELITSDPVVIG